MACSLAAWSSGLKVFAVRNGSKCQSDKDFISVLPRLKASKGCLGGRGGLNASDVYRLTRKKAFSPLLYQKNLCLKSIRAQLFTGQITLSNKQMITKDIVLSTKYKFNLLLCTLRTTKYFDSFVINLCASRDRICLRLDLVIFLGWYSPIFRSSRPM